MTADMVNIKEGIKQEWFRSGPVGSFYCPLPLLKELALQSPLHCPLPLTLLLPWPQPWITYLFSYLHLPLLH